MPSALSLSSSLSHERICQVLSGFRYNFQDEDSLQQGLALALELNSIFFRRELRLDAKNRPDFMVGAVAIEVKIKGSFAQFLRQADRYLELDEIEALIVVGTPKWMSAVPASMRGKPIYTVRLMSSLL